MPRRPTLTATAFKEAWPAWTSGLKTATSAPFDTVPDAVVDRYITDCALQLDADVLDQGGASVGRTDQMLLYAVAHCCEMWKRGQEGRHVTGPRVSSSTAETSVSYQAPTLYASEQLWSGTTYGLQYLQLRRTAFVGGLAI